MTDIADRLPLVLVEEVNEVVADLKEEIRTVVDHARDQVPPDWHERARGAGKKDPCPICKATGSVSTRPRLDGGAEANLPYMKCYHCGGSGDESAVRRRNYFHQHPRGA
jgi:hypothetical protein